MDRHSLIPSTSSPRGASYGSVYASDHSYIHQGDTYITQDPTYSEYEAFRHSLGFPDLSLREESIKVALDGTFEWIYQNNAGVPNSRNADAAKIDQRYVASDKFKTWLCESPPRPRFWIRGKAGSGKSTFMSFVSSHDSLNARLQASDSSRNHVVLRHYFWHLGTPLQRNLTGFLRSVTWQFFATNPDLGFEIWNKHFKPRRMVTWSIFNLTNVLRTILVESKCSFCLFLDGLDECIDSDDVMSLLHGLESLQNLKVCISSRPERRYDLAFKTWPTLHLDRLTYSDMRLYAEKRLQSLFQSNAQITSTSLYFNDLVRSLIRKAEGVFVWLCIVVQSLREGFENIDDSSMLLQRVDEYPEDIHQLYLFILERHKGNLTRYKANGAAVFKLLLRNQVLAPDRSLRLYLPYGQDKESSSLVLTRLAWARDEKLRSKFFISDLSVASIERIWKELQLESTCAQLPVHCGNFVEVIDHPLQILQHRAKMKSKVNRPDLADLLFRNQYVQFIHKTVADFLVNQESGRTLLSSDSATEEELDSSLRDADLVIAITYLILVREAKDKSCRVLVSASGDPSISYNRWSLIESVIMKAFSDNLLPDCYHCLLGYEFATITPPRRDQGFLFYCVTSGRLDYLLLAMNDPERHIKPRVLTDLLSLVILLFVYEKKANGRFPRQDLVTAVSKLLECGANPSTSLFSPHSLPGGQACPPSAHTLLSLTLHIAADNPFGEMILGVLSSHVGGKAECMSSGPSSSQYRFGILHWYRRGPDNQTDEALPKLQSYSSGLTIPHNHEMIADTHSDRILMKPTSLENPTLFTDPPGCSSDLENLSEPVVLKDAHLRLVLWHQEKGFWLVPAPEVSKRFLEGHELLKEEIAFGLGLPGHHQGPDAVKSVDPGLIWLRFIDGFKHLTSVNNSDMRCAFRQVFCSRDLFDAFRHLQWPNVDIDYFAKYCNDYRERSDPDVFAELTIKALSTVVNDGRWRTEMDLKLYLRSCMRFVRRLNYKTPDDNSRNDAFGAPRVRSFERVVHDWKLIYRAKILTLDDFLLRFLRTRGSSLQPEYKSSHTIAHSASSDDALSACSACGQRSLPCFGVPSATEGNSCMTCLLKRRPCSFDAGNALTHRLTASKHQSNKEPTIIRNLTFHKGTAAYQPYCWFEGIHIATVASKIEPVSVPLKLTSRDWPNASLQSPQNIPLPFMFSFIVPGLITVTDRLSQMLHNLIALGPQQNRPNALRHLARTFCKTPFLEEKDYPVLTCLLERIFEFSGIARGERERQRTWLFDMIRHEKWGHMIKCICDAFIVFDNGLIALPSGDSEVDRTISCGHILVVVNHDDTHDSVLLSRIESSTHYTFVGPVSVPHIGSHVPEWDEADVQLFTITK